MVVSAGSSGATFTAAAERFTAETGIPITVTTVPMGDVRQQAVLALSTGSADLDIIPFVGDWLTVMNDSGEGLLDLNEMMAADGTNTDRIIPALLDLFSSDGGQYALPVRLTSFVFAYREDVLAEAGYAAPPATWDEFEEIARKLTDPSQNRYGAGMVLGQTNLMVDTWGTVVTSSGGSFLKSNGELALTGPHVVEATERIVGWIDEGILPPDSLQYTDSELIAAYNQGRIPMGIISSAWFGRISDTSMSDFGDQFRIAPRVPSGPNGSGQSMVQGWGFGINPASNNKEAAWEFIKFITSEEIQAWLALEHNNEPTTAATFEDPAYLAEKPQAINIMTAVQDGYPSSEKIDGWADVRFGLEGALSEIWAGDYSAVEGLQRINQSFQSFLPPIG